MLCGVLHMHTEHRLEHRDLKPPNVLITSLDCTPGQPLRIEAKIADFGLAESFGLATRGSGGTPLWQAPEQLDGSSVEIITGAVDVWAMAVIILSMFSPQGTLRYEANGQPGEDEWRSAMAANTAFSSRRSELGPGVPTAVADLLDTMLRAVPSDRPSMREVLVQFEAALPAAVYNC
jgi:serine/threonine protein kinase